MRKFFGIMFFIIVGLLLVGCKAKEVKVTFDSNGGSNVEEMVIKKGSLFELPKEPKLEGHRFLGWQLEGVIFEEGEKVTKNITLVAKWEKLKFTITFDSDGGSDVEKIVKDYGEKLTSLPAPTKANHGFQGWYDGTTKVEAPYTVSEDVTLKAKWGVDTHTIIFDSNGGNTIEVMTVDHNQEITELPTPTKEGFTFKGWYDGDTEVSVPLKVKKALNLVAKWEAKKYTITYNLDGGTNTPENPESYTLEDEDFLLKSPTKEDYNFDGWYDEENLKVSKIYTISQKNYVLTARYSPKQYALVNPLPEGISLVNPNLSLDKLEVGTQVMFKITIPANQLVDVLRVNGNDATSTIDQNNQFKVTITPELTIAVIYVNKTHTITFNLGRNAQPMEPLSVPHRAKITSLEPPVPLYSTCTFVEWHYMGHPFDYSMPITTDMTLEAVFDIKFLFELEDALTIPARGTVIVGKVITGTINVNDMIYDYINNIEIKVLEIIDENNQQVESATAGDMIGLLLGEAITKEDASKIYSWFKMGEVQLTRKLTIEIRLLTAEEGGRKAPIFPGYISNSYIYKHNHSAKFVSFTNLDGTPASQMDPGNTYRVEIELEPTALSFAGVTGIEITIKEGERVIAVGKVVAIVKVPVVVKAEYTGSQQAFMELPNNASLLGLDETVFKVRSNAVGGKNPTYIMLASTGVMKLNFGPNGEGHGITVSLVPSGYVITECKITFGSSVSNIKISENTTSIPILPLTPNKVLSITDVNLKSISILNVGTAVLDIVSIEITYVIND